MNVSSSLGHIVPINHLLGDLVKQDLCGALCGRRRSRSFLWIESLGEPPFESRTWTFSSTIRRNLRTPTCSAECLRLVDLEDELKDFPIISKEDECKVENVGRGSGLPHGFKNNLELIQIQGKRRTNRGHDPVAINLLEVLVEDNRMP